MGENPEDLKNMNSVKTDEVITFVSGLSRDIDDERTRRKMIDQAIDRLDRLRYGVRPKKIHPWPGAANYSIPLIDTDINKIKPSYINTVFGADPIANFEPFGAEDVEPAKKREVLFDWRMRHKVDFFFPLNYGVDMILGSPGQTVFRVIWKYSARTYNVSVDISEFDEEVQEALYDPRLNDEGLFKVLVEEFRLDMSFEENVEEIQKAVEKFRNGETDFDLTFLETRDDRPEVTACSIKDDLIIPTDTKDIQDARFIDYKFWMTKNDLKIAFEDGKYNKYADEDIDSWAAVSTDTDNKHKGFHVFETDELIMLHETCCWYDINNDGIKEKCIVTWPDGDPSSVLRFIELPYEHGLWPYVQVKRELTENGFYASRGVPSLDEDFQVGISTAVNQAIDNGTLLNMPERVYKVGTLSNPRNRRFVPGEAVEVTGDISQYQTRQTINASQPVLFQQAQFLKSFSDARHGNVTSGLSNQTDLPGQGQGGKKTAKEVEAIMGEQGQTLSFELMIFQHQIVKVYYQVDALYNQYGPEEEEVLITNEEPQKISRREIQGKFNITPNGRPDSTSPQARIQRMMMAFNIGFGNPYVKQDVLTRELYRTLDHRMAAILLKSPEELQQEQEQAQQAEQEQIAKTAGVRKLMDDFDIRKEVLLEPVIGKKFAPG